MNEPDPYELRVFEATYLAIAEATKLDNGKSLIDTGRVARALLRLIAFYSASGYAGDSPARAREFGETAGELLRKFTLEARAHDVAGTLGMVVVRVPEDGTRQ